MRTTLSAPQPIAAFVLATIAVALAAGCGDSGGARSSALSGSSGGLSPQQACSNPRYAWRGQGDGIFRSATIDAGEWIYTNGLWQARGANADALERTQYFAPAPADDPGFIKRDLYLANTYDFFGSHRATHNGDYQLPQNTAMWPDGMADLVELRLVVTPNELRLRWTWNSQPRPDAQIATLTLRSATDAPPVASPWPRNAKLSGRYTHAITMWGTGGALQTADGREQAVVTAGGDHSTEVCVPRDSLPTGAWAMAGGAGLSDPVDPTRYWTVPTGNATPTAPGSGGPLSPTHVWTLLFANDVPWSFDELAQSRLLSAATTGDAEITLDPNQLTANASTAAPVREGRYSRLIVSQHFAADGITRAEGAVPAPNAQPPPGVNNPDFNVSYFYTGRYQPYAMQVPAGYAASSAAYPLIVYLHGFTGLPEEPFHNPVGLTEMAEREGYLFASALGRGDYFYKAEGDLDVMEVMADVQRHYRVDPNRIYLMGHSMGGFGSHNVGTRHPDLFAAIAPAQGTDAEHLYQNLRNLPWFIMTSDQDLDANAEQALGMYGLLSGAGFDATILQYRTKIHEYSSIYDTLPRLFAYFASHTRNPNPPIVSYTQRPSEQRADLGLLYDSAYWMSGLRATDGAADATVTLETLGIAHAADDPAAAQRSDAAVNEGGPTGRTLAQLKRTIPATGTAMAVANRLRVTGSNLGAVQADLARAQLRLDANGLVIDSSSDTAYTLRLAAPGVGAVESRIGNGSFTPATVQGGVVVLAVPSGNQTLTVRTR